MTAPENQNPHTTDLDRIRAILRRKAPVWRDEASGSFVLTRHDDVRALLADRSLLKDPAQAEPGCAMHKSLQSTQPEGLVYRTAGDSILTMDDPGHSRIRTPLAKAFYKRVAAARGLVEDAVGRILHELDGRKRFDAMAGFAIPVRGRTRSRASWAPILRCAMRSARGRRTCSRRSTRRARRSRQRGRSRRATI